jgi:hypothetical protein
MTTHKKRRKQGSGHTSLDPEVLKQNPPSTLKRKPGSTEDLAEKALKEQAARKAASAAASSEEDPPRKSSVSSTGSDPTEFQENPLQKLRGRKIEPSDNFKGTVREPDPIIKFFGVQRDTRKSGRRSRKNKKRKTRRKR